MISLNDLVLVSGEVVLANERDRGAVHNVKVDTVCSHGTGSRSELTVAVGCVLCWWRRGH